MEGTNQGTNPPISCDIKEIMSILPHRYPFLLIDKVTELDTTKGTITAIKNVTINEPFFTGHFPGEPIMPGVLTLEMMAQACGMLGIKFFLSLASDNKLGNSVYLLSIDNAKFRLPVRPGDVLVTKANFVKHKKDICLFNASTFIDGKLAASADITAKVNFAN